jgi:hypothetical protein
VRISCRSLVSTRPSGSRPPGGYGPPPGFCSVVTAWKWTSLASKLGPTSMPTV